MHRHGAAAAALALIASGCAISVASPTPHEADPMSPLALEVQPDEPAGDDQTLDARDDAQEPTATSSTSTTATPSTTAPITIPEDATPTTTTTEVTATTAATTSTTIATGIPEGVHDADCVRVATARHLDDLAEQHSTTSLDLWIENGFRDDVRSGDLVDVCVDNGVDDVTGEANVRQDDPAVTAERSAKVERQQEKLNELFAPFGTSALAVDGISGPRTRQRLCAARLSLGLGASLADMLPGSAEDAALFAAAALLPPPSGATESERWVLIDRTCQMMFVGSGQELTFAFPTSTGTAGFETRVQNRAEVFRYNPAVENGGWHDSTEYPVGVDNPLNGNLYKPLYFDLGQAIHGATNVPAEPASKGCARLTVGNQEQLLAWLGLLDATEETWRTGEINLTVNVQGDYAGPGPGE